jgi:ethanolamine ammonia-lyase large subunit
VDQIDGALPLRTRSLDRADYIAHPVTGEELDADSEAALAALRAARGDYPPMVQLVVSDGLNVHALMDDGHLLPYLAAVRGLLAKEGVGVATETLVLRHGRVRAGYRCGERLFSSAADERRRAIVHAIGERPGSGHHNFSIYLAAAPAYVWRKPGAVDHDTARVVSGASDTALEPSIAARRTVEMLRAMLGGGT